MTKHRWLEPSDEPPEQRAIRKRLAQENPPTPEHVIRQLDAMQAQRPKQASPQPSSEASPPRLHPQQRYEPRATVTSPDPQPIAERPDPRALNEPEAEPPAPYVPPPELIELVRLWQSLPQRDQIELLYLARIKASLNK